MSDELVTDRSAVMLLSIDEIDGAAYEVIPLVRTSPPVTAAAEGIVCDFCGTLSKPLPGCEGCGYPLS